ncbi:MAG: substrate-binding domain-containing protein [Nitrososphaerales archaeon]
MRVARRGVSTAIIAVAAIAVIAAGVAAYAVSTSSGRTTKTTSTATATVTSTSTSVSTSVALAPLISYSADAYAAEATALLNGFSQSTGISVAPVKSGGSFADANAIAAGAPDDVFVSSSLAAASSQYLENLTSGWAIGFASDQLVLAYTNSTTQTSATINIISLANTATNSNSTSDWNNFYAALVSGGVKIGISAPAQDPAGLRAWLVLEAAGYLYSGGNQQAYVSTLLKDQGNVTGASAALLVAPLQAGQIQFLFTYKSSAISNELNYIPLNSHVNLGTPSLSSFYSKFSYTDSAGTTKGAAIVISVTIPLSAVNTVEALEFVQYVVHNAETLSSYGLQPFATPLLYDNVAPPAPIQALVSQGLLIEAGPLP